MKCAGETGDDEMRNILAACVVAGGLSGCAQTSVQQMSADTFQVAATTAPICGRSGAADVTSKMAAIQVIRMGGDRYIMQSPQTGSEWGGGLVLPMQRAQQSVVVRMVQPGDPEYARALSARQILGNNWAELSASGKPNFC